MHFYGTIGPACASAGTLRRLVDAGMTGLRMNLSHGALAEHADWLAMIHAVGIPDLLIDLQGPELRVGRLASPVTLPEGGTVQLGAGGIPCPDLSLSVSQHGQHCKGIRSLAGHHFRQHPLGGTDPAERRSDPEKRYLCVQNQLKQAPAQNPKILCRSFFTYWRSLRAFWPECTTVHLEFWAEE